LNTEIRLGEPTCVENKNANIKGIKNQCEQLRSAPSGVRNAQVNRTR